MNDSDTTAPISTTGGEDAVNDSQRQTVGPWTLGDRLGRGGNASVWRATRPGSAAVVALKLINTTKVEREPYQRFVREIEFLRDHQDIPGLLPLLGAHLPDQPDKTNQPWLAMPIATPIATALEGRPLADVVGAIAAIAYTLAQLQRDFGIAHRDIKPGNLYELDGKWLIGDFGLIAVPDAKSFTLALAGTSSSTGTAAPWLRRSAIPADRRLRALSPSGLVHAR